MSVKPRAERGRKGGGPAPAAPPFRDMVELADVMIAVFRGGKVLYGNPKLCGETGCPLAELRRTPLAGLVHPDDRREAAGWLLTEGRSAEPVSPPRFRLLCRDRSACWIEARTRSVRWRGRPAVLAVLVDVTRHVDAETEIESGRARLQALIDASLDAITITDETGVFLASNRALQERWGKSRDGIVGHSAAEVLAPETFAARLERVRRCLASGQADHFFDNRGDRWFENTMAPVLEADGRIRSVAMFSRDVSAQKQAEEELRRSEERYRAIFESTATANALVAENGTILLVNANFETLVGSPRAELEEIAAWSSFVARDDRPRMEQFLGACRAGSGAASAPLEFRGVDRDGRTRHLYMKAAMMPGDRTAILSLIDVTDQVLAEQGIREREKMVQAGLEISRDWIWFMDLDGINTYSNPAIREILGYEAGEIVGQPVDLMHPEDRRMVRERMPGWIRNRQGWKNLLVRFRHRNGTWRFLESSAIPILDAEGRVTGFRGVDRDVTDHRELEERLRQSQKMEAVGQLAGGVAHDFNNILQAILGYSDMLGQELAPGSPAHSRLAEIRKAGRRAADLTRQLLAFSRRQVLQLAPLDLNHVIEETLGMLRPLIGANIELAVEPGSNLPAVNADRGQVGQVIMNLCINGRDAMPGGGRLAIETGSVRLGAEACAKHEWARPGRYVRISVTDTGIGMDDETREKIFEPFFTTKGPGRGTGLGMATVYGIVRQHNGMIQVFSEPGQGSRINVYLPALQETAAAPAPRPDTGDPGGHETILLAEDNEQVRGLARAILEESGYTVLSAGDGAEALAMFRRHETAIDLLLLDVVMPRIGGKGVFDEIRPQRPGLPCLFISGYSGNALPTGFISGLGLQLLQKPFTRNALLRAVRAALDGARPKRP